MNVFIVVDDHMGMMFNHRRQSQDKVLREYIINECGNEKLWMNEYTSGQFELPTSKAMLIDEAFLDKAGEDDYCFVENLPLAEYENKIKKIILFKWNRTYPADMYFDITLPENGWELESVSEFEGNSHQRITKEIWVNEKGKENL